MKFVIMSNKIKKDFENRQKIVHKFNENPTWSHSMIAKSIGIPKSTVGNVLRRFKETLTIERKKGQGRKSGPANKNLHQKIIRSFKQNPGLSNRKRAERLQTSEWTVRKTKLRGGYTSYKSIKIPNRNEKQSSVVKTRARRLYNKVLTKFNGCLIIDDETYVKVDQKQIPGQTFYVAKKRLDVPNKYKFVQVCKFGKKLLIWQAICSCGMKSKAFVTATTLTSNLYMKECLEKRLIPFIKRHKSSVKFWPDLASCHYSNATLGWYQENKVDLIPKGMNPPNVPEFRPIEKFWAIGKRKFKATRRTIRNEKDMLFAWTEAVNKIESSTVRTMMGTIKTKVRKFIRTGEIAP